MFSFEQSAVTIFLVFAVILSSIIIGFYCRQLNFQQVKRTEFDKKAVLVITAHPDDECMFFSPAILNLKRSSTVHLLCLSTGNYYKQGEIRKQELLSSCGILGIPPSHVTVIDHSSLQDDPSVDWDTNLVGKIITDHINHNKIQAVVTFDLYGVSGHTNHIALFKAVKTLKDKGLLEGVAIFVLSSISLLRKYISLLDLPFCVYSRSRKNPYPPHGRSLEIPFRSQEAMCAHRSQLVWFRKLYILFSRFMVINTLEELN